MTEVTAIATETINIASFLKISREFLGLNTNSVPVRSNPRRTATNRYRRVARSLLFATGFGAFMSSHAFADGECRNTNDREARHARYSKMEAQRQQQLHDALRLTAEQESGWEKLLASESSRQFPGVGQLKDWSSLSVPERAEKMLEFSRKQQARMTEHVAALKNFYAMLNTDQKKTFEAFHAGPSGIQNPGVADPPPSS